MDNFEKHIRENAAQFDGHRPDKEKMWAHIAGALKTEEPKVIPLWKSPVFKIAASVVLVVGLAVFMTFSMLRQDPMETQYVSKELLDIDRHYKTLVSYQVQLVQNHPELSQEDKSEFLSFMDELDAEYAQLRLEMNKNLDNEQVLEAIVSNYRQRIELIEKLLKQINESKVTDDDYGYTL